MIPLLIGAAAAAAGIAIASSSDDEESTSQSESKSVKAVDESRVPAHIRAKANMKSQNNVQSDKSAIDACMNEMHHEIQSRENRGIEYYGGTVKLRYINESKFKLSYELYFSDDDLSKSYTFDFDQLPPDARRQLRNEKIVSFDLNDNQDQSQDQSSDESESKVETIMIDSLLDLRNFVDDVNFVFDLCKARDDTLKKYPNKQSLGGVVDIGKNPDEYILAIIFKGEDMEVAKQGSIRIDSISGDARKIIDRDGEVYIMFT